METQTDMFKAIEPKLGSQQHAILEHLRQGKSLTRLEALNLFGTMQGQTRVSELRQMGHPIKSETIKTPSGKRVSRYWI